MFASRRRPRRRTDSVGLRFDRAMTRIDTVDPYDAQRRIGEAMVVAGLVDEADLPEETELPDESGADRRGDRRALGRTPRIKP